FLLLTPRLSPLSTLFPYTTLFRSHADRESRLNLETPLEVYETLPIVPLRDVVVFPHMMMPFVIGRPSSTRALEHALLKDKRIFLDRKSTRLNSSHQIISYAVFCLK